MHVRAAETEDIDAIAAILNREIAEGVAHFGAAPCDASDVRKDFESARRGVRFDAGNNAACPAFLARYPWVVAVEADEAGEQGVIGFARAGAWKTREAYAWSTEIGVYVRPGFHCRGVGTALYAALFPMLQAAGFRCILAGIALPNDASVRLHEAFGMTQAGVLPRVGFKFGVWRDVGYWAKTLPDR